MKKLISLFLVVAFLFPTLSGCGPTPILTTVPHDLPTVIPQLPHHILVTSKEDHGDGTLRQALEAARPFDRITFDLTEFPPNEPTRIALLTSLPQLARGNLTIDASNAGVILDGNSITTDDTGYGLEISSDHNVIRGLQITGFSDAGIGLHGGAQYNMVGGDRSIGTGPFGQGNLISGNANFGIGLWEEDTSHNTIQGNYIGINPDGTSPWGHARDGIHSNGATGNLIKDNVIGKNEMAGVYLCCAADGMSTVEGNLIGVGPDGESLGNGLAGVLIDRTSHNMVGPDNMIAHNIGDGILFWEGADSNTVSKNSIHDNDGRGIVYPDTSPIPIQSPLIFSFDLVAGQLAGWAGANSNVEVFSDIENEGASFEGNVMSDSHGFFTFNKAGGFGGPHLTATATGIDGSTSGFSLPVSGSDSYLILQGGNRHTKEPIITKASPELEDNRIGGDYGDFSQGVNNGFFELGLKWVRVAFDGSGSNLNWQRVERTPGVYTVDPVEDAAITTLADNGVNVILNLGVGPGDGITGTRFETEEEMDAYINYVLFMVKHFQDRVAYFELWNEPGGVDPATGVPSNIGIDVELYAKAINRIVDEIQEAGLNAQIMIGALGGDWIYHDPNYPDYGDYARSFLHQEYLKNLIATGVVNQINAISWHPFYGNIPSDDYYQTYPDFVSEIKAQAASEGFTGEYFAEEIKYYTEPNTEGWGESAPVVTENVAAKYYTRAIVMHRGLDFTVSTAGQTVYGGRVSDVIRALCTVMDTARPIDLPVNVQSSASNIVMYGFSLQNGSRLFALWTNDGAVDDDSGVNANLTFPHSSARSVIGVDVLNGFEQELVIETGNGDLVIRNLLVKDYPIFIRFTDFDGPTPVAEPPLEMPFTGEWEGIDPDDSSSVTLSLAQIGAGLTGSFADTYSGNTSTPGFEGNGFGITNSDTTAQMRFDLSRPDSSPITLQFVLTLSDNNNMLTLNSGTGWLINLQRR